MSSIVFLREEFARQRDLGRKAIAQASDSGINHTVGEHNSIGVGVGYLHGLLIARFTDFLTSDGSEPWRRGDEKAVVSFYPRGEVERLYREAWAVADATLSRLSDADLVSEVSVQGRKVPAEKVLLSLLTHVAHHVGQIALLARQAPATEWNPSSPDTQPAAPVAQAASSKKQNQ